jgi:hypothetical protein
VACGEALVVAITSIMLLRTLEVGLAVHAHEMNRAVVE